MVDDHVGDRQDAVLAQRREAAAQVCLAAVCSVQAVQVLQQEKTNAE